MSDTQSNSSNSPPEPIRDVHKLLWIQSRLSCVLCHKITLCILVPVLVYHLFVYIYLGERAGGADFYTGFMYAFNYAGASVAYWIVYRQSKSELSSSCVISRELIQKPNTHNSRCLSCKHESIHFQFMQNNMDLLENYRNEHIHFQKYCTKWQNRTLKIIFAWMGFATYNILAKVYPSIQIANYDTFDNEPLGGWGYFNLSGQYIASLTLTTGAVMILSSFFQLKCMIIGFANYLRSFRLQNSPSQVNVSDLPETYLSIQKACLALGELLSIPVVVSLFFCTQVIISNILVIHYSLEDCQLTKNCDFHLIYPVIWVSASLFITGTMLMGMASINQASDVLKQIFVFSKAGDPGPEDYSQIGGRKSWLDYLESNKLDFCICGMTITPTFVINSCYTVGTAVASILASYVLG